MNRDDFNRFRDGIYQGIVGLNETKGADYAGDEDALGNFKEAASELGVSPYTIWFVYFHKHWSAIRTFLKEGQVESEPIEGRIDDAILYLFLLRGLISDHGEATRASMRAQILEERAVRIAENDYENVHVVDPPEGGRASYRPVHPSPWDILQNYATRKLDREEQMALAHELKQHGHDGELSFTGENGHLVYRESRPGTGVVRVVVPPENRP